MDPNGGLQNALIRPINSYLLPIAPQAQLPMPQMQGPSQAQLNSFRSVYQMSTPQQRQQMLQQAKGTPFEQAIQGMGVNAPNPYAVPGPDLGTRAYQLGSGLVQGALDQFIPNQTAGSMESQLQHDATGRVINPQAIQGGHAASQLDVARQAIADRLMTKGVTQGLPGMAGTNAGVEAGSNVLQAGIQRGMQMAPGFMGANAVTSFNGDGTPVTPMQQVGKTATAAVSGAGQALGFGVGGELLGAAGRLGMNGVRRVAGALDNQGGYIGGSKATGFPEAQAAGAVTPGVDGHPKFEVDDSQAKFNFEPLSKGPAPLPEIMQHPYLYEDYEALANTKVKYDPTLSPNAKGFYDRNTDTIILNPNPRLKPGETLHDSLADTIAHEYTHFIQTYEGHASGGSPESVQGLAASNDTTPMQAYRALAGEAEARNVAARRTMTQAQREATPFNQTYDVAPDRQLVHYDQGTPLSKDPIADTLGLPKNQRKPTAPKVEQPIDRTLMARPEAAALRKGTEGMTVEEIRRQQARMDSLNASTKNQVDLNPGEGGIKSAIANSQMVEYELSRRGDQAYRLGQGLSTHDRLLARNYESGMPIEELAQRADNPKKFAKALSAVEDYYDYRLAAERAAGAQVPKVNNYLRHYWNLDNPKDLARFNELATQKGLSKFNGVSSQPRAFSSYKEGIGAGFKPLNSDVFKDVAMDANQSRARVGQAALKEGVIRAGRDEISTAGNGIDAKGKPFVNSNVPGLEGLSYSKAIDDQLKGYRGLDRNVFGKAYDDLNRFQKNVVLSLSIFHSLNISINFSGSKWLRHPIVVGKGLGQSVLSFVSPKYFDHVMKGFDERGVTEWATRNGISLGVNGDIAPEGIKAKVGASRLNPIAQGHKAIFEREIPIMTLHMAELGRKAGIAAGSKEGITYGQEINNVMGLLNQKILSRDPNAQKWLNRVMLAPAFTETKFRTMIDAATKWRGDNKAAGNLAREAVVGKTALAGLIGIVGGIIATGKYPTLQQVLGQVTNPYVPTNIKNKSGGTKGAFLPHTFISELADPLTKLAHGDTSGVIHYANARLSPNLSTANKLLTNQDYFGNPIFDPNKPIGPQIAGQAAKQIAPIGVQNALNATGPNAKGLPETLLDEAGLSVKNDPNNPINQRTAAYFQARNDVLTKLTPNQKADFNSINPATKNPDGSYTPEANFNPFKSAQKVYTLLKDPAVLDATIKLNQSQPNHDPMWDLPKDKLDTFLTYQGIQGTDYGIATAKELEAQNPFIQEVNTARSSWFATLPPSQNPDGKNPIQYPQMDAATQQLMDTYTNLPDAKSKAQFLQNNPQLTQQFDAMNQYTQDRRTQQGVPVFAQSPVATPYVQMQMNSGNFKDPQVQQYLNAQTAFKASGPFGDGIGGAGGNHNTSPQALANLRLGLQANGKPQYNAASRSAQSSLLRRARNSMKYGYKDAKYNVKKSQQHLGVSNTRGIAWINPTGHAYHEAPTSHLQAALMKNSRRDKA